MTPWFVVTTNMPLSYAGRYCCSQLLYSSLFTLNRGEIAPHFVIFANNLILNVGNNKLVHLDETPITMFLKCPTTKTNVITWKKKALASLL